MRCPTIGELQENTRAYFRRERERQKQMKQERRQTTNRHTPVQQENHSTPVTHHDTENIQRAPNVNYNFYNTAPPQHQTKTEKFNFIAFTGIIVTIVAVYLAITDSYFKNIFVNTWKSTLGQLSMNLGLMLLVVAILLVVLLFRKK